MQINEVNKIDFKGSMGPGLIPSKFWALTMLSKFKKDFDVVYVLGSWYGNTSLLLSMDYRFTIGKIINVETNKSMLKISDQLARLQGYDNIEPMLRDANRLDYRQLNKNSLVINFSCNNIQGQDWFKNIPKGTFILLSGRNNDEQSVNQFENFESFVNNYKLSKTLFAGEKEFKDPETKYNLYLVIGIT